jgi:hypothetical protein
VCLPVSFFDSVFDARRFRVNAACPKPRDIFNGEHIMRHESRACPIRAFMAEALAVLEIEDQSQNL